MSQELTLKTASIDCDGTQFTTTQFPAMHSLEVLTKLVKVLGPVITTLVSVDQKSEVSSIGPQLQQAMMGVTPVEMKALVKEMLASTTVVWNGKIMPLNSEEKINLVFSSRLGDMFKVFGHAVEVNFADFFAEAFKRTPEGPQTPVE